MTLLPNYTEISHIGNGTTTRFSIPWKFHNEEIAVYYNKTDRKYVKGVDYTIENNGDNGYVVFKDAPEKDVVITIVRDVLLDQEITFIEGEDFPARDYEWSLDKIFMALQQLKRGSERFLSVPPGQQPDGYFDKFQIKGNMVSSISEEPSNDLYPSEKAVSDAVSKITKEIDKKISETVKEETKDFQLKENLVTTLSESSTNETYPGAKTVFDAIKEVSDGVDGKVDKAITDLDVDKKISEAVKDLDVDDKVEEVIEKKDFQTKENLVQSLSEAKETTYPSSKTVADAIEKVNSEIENKTKGFQTTDNLVTEIAAGLATSKYPNVQAVIDYVASHSGGEVGGNNGILFLKLFSGVPTYSDTWGETNTTIHDVTSFVEYGKSYFPIVFVYSPYDTNAANKFSLNCSFYYTPQGVARVITSFGSRLGQTSNVEIYAILLPLKDALPEVNSYPGIIGISNGTYEVFLRNFNFTPVTFTKTTDDWEEHSTPNIPSEYKYKTTLYTYLTYNSNFLTFSNSSSYLTFDPITASSGKVCPTAELDDDRSGVKFYIYAKEPLNCTVKATINVGVTR